jgi:hypothetical protein
MLSPAAVLSLALGIGANTSIFFEFLFDCLPDLGPKPGTSFKT